MFFLQQHVKFFLAFPGNLHKLRHAAGDARKRRGGLRPARHSLRHRVGHAGHPIWVQGRQQPGVLPADPPPGPLPHRHLPGLPPRPLPLPAPQQEDVRLQQPPQGVQSQQGAVQL